MLSITINLVKASVPWRAPARTWLPGILDVRQKPLYRRILALRRQCIKGHCLNCGVGILEVLPKRFRISFSCSRLGTRVKRDLGSDLLQLARALDLPAYKRRTLRGGDFRHAMLYHREGYQMSVTVPTAGLTEAPLL